MARSLRLLLLLALCVSVASCAGRGRRGAPECFDNGDCNDERGAGDTTEIEACRDGECDVVDCLSSPDCPIGTWCDAEDEDFVCREGCQQNSDCFAGQECDGGTCREYGCRSTILDCDFNEICDQASGECEQAPGLQCTGCDPLGHYIDNMGTLGDVCDDEIGGHPICGGDGNFCGPDGDNTVCWVSCDTAGDPNSCPSGFQCSFVSWTPSAGCDPVPLGPICLPTAGCNPSLP